MIIEAFFSEKYLHIVGNYCVFSDVDGNQYAVTHSAKPGESPGWTFSDTVYLGLMVKWNFNRNGKKISDIPSHILTAPISKKFDTSPSGTEIIISSNKAINDYVCPGCRNDKCSKTEKSCWKCGFQFLKVNETLVL